MRINLKISKYFSDFFFIIFKIKLIFFNIIYSKISKNNFSKKNVFLFKIKLNFSNDVI